MELGQKIMKIVIQIGDVVGLTQWFREAPLAAMKEVVTLARNAAQETLEKVMEAEMELFLGGSEQAGNKRNGYRTRTYAVKGLGSMTLRVPRDRVGGFQSAVIPAGRRYDTALEKDMALLHLAGLSSHMLSHLSQHLLGLRVSAQEVSNALHTIVPSAKKFLRRSLEGRKYKYLYLDGTNFSVRRTTVEKEPVLVVIGVDEQHRKSVLALENGDKESRRSWEMVFSDLKERGLDPSSIELGIMDGLPGLADAFVEAFPHARVARCWVHKARNVFPRVPRRYQGEFKSNWDAMQYADNGTEAREAFGKLKERWSKVCEDAVECIERDLEALLVHYSFFQEHWDALRTTNPIERVHKEFKRRSKAMDVVSPEGLKALLAFTALRLEYGWMNNPIGNGRERNLPNYKTREQRKLESVTSTLLN